MWKLDPPSKDIIQWYKNAMLPGLVKRVMNSGLPDDVKSILLPAVIPFKRDESELEGLLIEPPVESKQRQDRLMELIVGKFPIYENIRFLLANLKRELVNVFDYEGQISKSTSKSYYLTHWQGKYTCTYCNRSYTITVVSRAQRTRGHKIGKNDSERIARPHLDHWYDKADYPLLSLNIFNLIPSCPVCNSAVKGKTNFDVATHIHPYLTEKSEPDFKFRLESNSEKNSDFPFIVGIDDSKSSVAERNTIRDLCLKEVYAYHGMLEAKDIYDWRIKNNYDYLKSLFSGALKKYHKTTEDIYRMFFGTEYVMDKNLDRPFSKLKRDILIQYGLLDENGNFIN